MNGLDMYKLELSGELLSQTAPQPTIQSSIEPKPTMKETFDSLFGSSESAQPSSQTERG